jgi:hypothetical protein
MDPDPGGKKNVDPNPVPDLNNVIYSRYLPPSFTIRRVGCVHRLPVVSPALNPQEAAMMEMLRQVELEDSMLSDHEVRHKSVFYVIFRPSV